PIPPGRQLRRPHPQGRESCRLAGAGADEVRTRYQSQDRESAGPHRSRWPARPRRRGDRMKRREFITLAGGTMAWPLAARAQQSGRRRIGVLMTYAADDPVGQARLLAFAQELAQSGWIDSRNVRIDVRWGAVDPERIRSYAAELIALVPDVIVATGSSAVGSLLQATRAVPIV